MSSKSPTRSSTRRIGRVLSHWFRIALLILALISSPFQFSLASCVCPQGQCCSIVEASCQCCDVTAGCCCASNDQNEQQADETCSSCSSQCQCGTIEVTSSSHQICQTETAEVALLPARLTAFLSECSLSSVTTNSISCVGLGSLRLHAFLCVWLN